MKLIKIVTIFVILMLFMSTCNTAEDYHFPGSIADIVMNISGGLDTNNEFRINSEGASKTLTLESNLAWKASIKEIKDDSEGSVNTFKVEPSSGKGNTQLVISALPNYSSGSPRKGILTIEPINIEMSPINIELIQDKFIFDMPIPVIDTVPSSGGNIKIQFASTVDWYLDILNNTEPTSRDWISIESGWSGKGAWGKDIELAIDIDYNLNYEERKITLQLLPQDTVVLRNLSSDNRHDPFTIVQKKNVDERYIVASAHYLGDEEIDRGRDCDIYLDYRSDSEIYGMGVRMYDYNSIIPDGSHTLVDNYEPEKTNDEYPLSGREVIHITNLMPTGKYSIVPYFHCESGIVVGETIFIYGPNSF